MTTPDQGPQRTPSYRPRLRGGWQASTTNTTVPTATTERPQTPFAHHRSRREAVTGEARVWRTSQLTRVFDIDAFWTRPQRRLTQDATERLSAVEAEVRAVSEGAVATSAASAVEAIWERVETICSLAESRLRLLLPKLEAPERAPRSQWLDQALRQLCTDPDASQSPDLAMRSTENLLRSLTARMANAPMPEVAWGPLGAVEVRWEGVLTWLVYPSRLPWPGIRARAIVAGQPGRASDARLFHLANSLVDHAYLVLTDDAR